MRQDGLEGVAGVTSPTWQVRPAALHLSPHPPATCASAGQPALRRSCILPPGCPPAVAHPPCKCCCCCPPLAALQSKIVTAAPARSEKDNSTFVDHLFSQGEWAGAAGLRGCGQGYKLYTLHWANEGWRRLPELAPAGPLPSRLTPRASLTPPPPPPPAADKELADLQAKLQAKYTMVSAAPACLQCAAVAQAYGTQHPPSAPALNPCLPPCPPPVQPAN